ncbi:MAG: N-acetylmuramoyl-L-alanine amidase [Candidatus Omnitrophica bacterium]|nr:N-acetylmuramoyl-L-alanine amidase [Candidatus Omnitrophota bacterium]
MRNLKSGYFFVIATLIFLIVGLSGCASVSRKGGVQSYVISGSRYFSLLSLCDLNNVKWDYDPLTRTADLSRLDHRIKLQTGGKIIFVDGSPRKLNEPVEIYRGMLVIPVQFRNIFEAMFSKSAVGEAISFNKIKKVIIDPGHGGKDPGTPGRSGMPEKDIVLDIAKRLSGILKSYGVETVLTRSSDNFIPLEKRAALTENSQADLFISIHANANNARSLSGFEVYCISPEISDYKRALSSARSSSLDLDKASLASPDMNLKAILWDMTYTYNRGEAIQLSRDICQSIGASVDTRIIGVKKANYCVLRGAYIPAILVEVGFLSNRKEEQLLNDPDYRQKIAEGIRRGIQDYAQGAAGVKPEKQNTNLVKSKEGRR